jgi:dTDP-glucose pyrophosphorylase
MINAPVERAVLLAAGRGKRLSPLTDRVPKPLLSLAGRPLLEYLLLHLRAAGVRKVLIVIGHLGEQIREHFGDGRGLDVDIDYREQSIPNGTGAAALLARDFVGSSPFFLGWGDILAARHEYARLLEKFRQDDPDALLLLEKVRDPSAGAAVHLDGKRITALIEKPPPGASTTPWNQAGLAALTPAIFPCLRRLRPSARGELEFTAAVQELIDTGHLVQGLPLRAPRLHLTCPGDIGRIEAILQGDPRYAPTPV